MLKRFLVFKGDHYYPGGGWRDFRGDFEYLEDALVWIQSAPADSSGSWAHVYDIEQKKVVVRQVSTGSERNWTQDVGNAYWGQPGLAGEEDI